jgi:hypothetical protein
VAFGDLESQVHPRLSFRDKVTAPSRELVGPGFNGVHVSAGFRRRKICRPTVVWPRQHRNAGPFVGGFRPPQQLRGKDGMTVPKNVGPYLHRLACNSLDRKSADVDERIDILDVDATTGKVADGGDTHVRCHVWIVHCRPVSPPGRQERCWWNR